MKSGLIRWLSATFISIVFLFGLNSCFEENWNFDKVSDEFELNPGIAAPIAYGSLSLDDILQVVDSTNYVKQFEDSLLYITYVEHLLSYPASEVVDIPDQQFLQFYISSDVAIPAWLLSSQGDTMRFHKEKNGEFTFTNNERLDSINIKTTTLHIHVESSFHHTGILNIYSDNILIDGQPFRREVQISDASGNFVYDVDIPIDGSSITLDNSDPDITVLPLEFDLDLINSGEPILPDESCEISMTFNNIEFYSIFGYLGDYDVLLSNGKVTLDIFDDAGQEGTLLFADPRLMLNVENSFGIPLSIELTDVSAYSSINKVNTDIVFQGVNPFYIDAPGLDSVGETSFTEIVIDKNNCNIAEAMKTQPESFAYSVNAATNPGGPSVNENFATDSSRLDMGFEVLLPIWIQADGFSLRDTLEWNFMDNLGGDTDLVNYLRLTLEGRNKLPMKTNMQVYFADADQNIVDSLFLEDDLFMEGAPLDVNDMVLSPVEVNKSVEFTGERIEKIKPTEYLIFEARANTRDVAHDRYVKFYSYYTIDFKLKLNADLTINSNEL